MPTNETSRRAVVTGGLAASTAIAATAVATRMAVGAPANNAELLALGRRFDALLAEWLPLRERYLERLHWCHRTARSRAALDPAPCDFCTPLTFVKHLADTEDESNLPELEVPHNDLDRQLESLVDSIDGATATTIAGLAVKARTARYIRVEAWSHDLEDCDYDEQGYRRLVETIEAFAAKAGV